MNQEKKKYLMTIVVLNVLILMIGVGYFFACHQNDITLYDIPLHTSEGIYECEQKNTFSTDYPKDSYYFMGQTGSLEAGIYDIMVYYSGDHQECYTLLCKTDMDGNSYPAIYAEQYPLSGQSNSFTYRIWVNNRIDHLDIRIKCGSAEQDIFEYDSMLYVDKIEVERDCKTSFFYQTLKLLVLLLIMDGSCCAFRSRAMIRENIYVVIGFTCIFLVSSLSLMSNFFVRGHDIAFHYARIVGLAEGLRAGAFPVRIQPGWLHNYGYPTSVCYGDILLYFPAILYLVGVPLVHVYKIYILSINLGTLFSSYFCFAKISGNKYIGITCSALYCLSVSRVLNLYLRAAVGEYSAYMFLPFVILGMRQIYVEESKQRFENGWLFLCLGMTGIIQTHVLSLEMTGLFIAIFVLGMICKMKKRIFVMLVKSAVFTVLLNLGFLLPFFDYATDTLKVFSERASYGIQRYGLSIYELFSFGSTATGAAYDSMERLSRRIPESLGLSMLIVLLLAVVVSAKCCEWQPWEKGELIAAVMLSVIALWMSTCYFPYDRLAVLPGFKNIIASIQFPWRFMSIAIPLMIYMACHVFVRSKDVFGKQKTTYLLIGICMISAFQALFCMDMINRNTEEGYMYYDYHPMMNAIEVVVSGEYFLTDTDRVLTMVERDLSGENIQTETLENRGLEMEAFCEAGQSAWVEFPRFAYKYYQCVDKNTKEVFNIIRGTNNKIRVNLPDNYKGILQLKFVEPWYWRLSELISLAMFLYIADIFRKRIWRNEKRF